MKVILHGNSDIMCRHWSCSCVVDVWSEEFVVIPSVWETGLVKSTKLAIWCGWQLWSAHSGSMKCSHWWRGTCVCHQDRLCFLSREARSIQPITGTVTQPARPCLSPEECHSEPGYPNTHTNILHQSGLCLTPVTPHTLMIFCRWCSHQRYVTNLY